MNNSQNTNNQNVIPFISAVFFMVLLLFALHYKEISHWLYVRNLWLIPIQIK